MINVNFSTNLDDVSRHEKFPTELSFRPMVGDLVQSLTEYRWKYRDEWQRGRHLTLKVCAVTITGENSLNVELHLKGHCIGQDTVSNFEKWYPAFRRGE